MGSSKVTIFTTQSCKKCSIVKAQIEAIPYNIEMVDAEESPEIATELGVMSVPTIVDLNNDVHVGAGACLAYIEANR